ncbi:MULTISPECIES: ribonuclease D [unclassified Adlercreutzia]|uniref:ribonuclease D n=1 Tax=unclassified Adlercreutzia TaxID=2636013 RepID=UPI0013ED7F58|nr:MULTISPECIES: ribonuclease D [unclassified Adlercreutzia]
MYIIDQDTFSLFLRRAERSSVLAIDTEFLREKTYYPRLCLLQLATDDEIAIVDPFEVRDLSPMRDVLLNEHVVKLFHAGSQDLEILLHAVGVLPTPVFDTQAASAVLGHTQQIGYAALVHMRCGVALKKADSFTDWSRRPLSESQLEYAADDVRYLPAMYRSMCDELRDKGRASWLNHEFEEMSDPAKYEIDVRERFRRLKRVSQLSHRQLSAAREVAAWRELEAQRRDVPRKWVLTDEQIVEACRREARTCDQLFMVRGVQERLSMSDARTVADLMASAFDAPPETWPDLGRSAKSEPNVDIELDLLNALVRLRARENDIAFQTLASHDDLVRLARGYRTRVDVLRGWRRTIVGDELVDLLEGRVCLQVGKNGVEVRRIDAPGE